MKGDFVEKKALLAYGIKLRSSNEKEMSPYCYI